MRVRRPLRGLPGVSLAANHPFQGILKRRLQAEAIRTAELEIGCNKGRRQDLGPLRSLRCRGINGVCEPQKHSSEG